MKVLFFGIFALIPSIGYCGGYGHIVNNHAQNVVVFDKQVVFDEDLYLGYDGYLSVVDQLKDAKQGEVQQLIELIKLQEERNSKAQEALIQLLKQGIVKPQQTDPNIVELPAGEKEIEPEPVPADDTKTAVLNVFKRKCATCHAANAANGVELLTTDRKLNPDLTDDDAKIIYTSVKGGLVAQKNKIKAMPLGKPALSPEEIDIVHNWMLNFNN